MLCQKCNKNEANTYYSQIINGKKTEMYLCPQCAKEMSVGNFSFGGFGFDSRALSARRPQSAPARHAARPWATLRRSAGSAARSAIPSLKTNCATRSGACTAT